MTPRYRRSPPVFGEKEREGNEKRGREKIYLGFDVENETKTKLRGKRLFPLGL